MNGISMDGAPRAEVRGHSAFFKPAHPATRFAAWLIDLAWMAGLLAVVLRTGRIPPFLDPPALALFVSIIFFFIIAQQALLGGTLGQRIWRLKRLTSDREHPRSPRGFWTSKIYQIETYGPGPLGGAAILTLIGLFCGIFLVDQVFSEHPAWRRAEETRLRPFFPAADAQADWMVAPFFYSIGAWPKLFGGQPILYSLPYEKGPPRQFVGHIIARWDMPDTQLTLEGPWTPESGVTPAALQRCLAEGFFTSGFECIRIRKLSLLKHLGAMEALHPSAWELRWFEVDNPAIPKAERPRGFFISATGSDRAQDRYVLINSKGTQQALILDRPLGSKGMAARKLLEETVRSQRVSDDLNTGRAWADRELQTIQLEALKNAQLDPHILIAKLAEIQVLLLSKISVDPKSFEAFYHLGGTSFLLAQEARKQKNLDWSAVAKPLVRNSLRYGQDVNSGDARNSQLENIWLEVRAY